MHKRRIVLYDARLRKVVQVDLRLRGVDLEGRGTEPEERAVRECAGERGGEVVARFESVDELGCGEGSAVARTGQI